MPTIMEMYNTGLEAAKNQALSPYYAPTAQAGLQAQLLKNKYYPQLTEADIASKQAYANYLPAQIASQIYSNPMMAYMIMKGLIPNPLRQWGINLPGQGAVTSKPSKAGLASPLAPNNSSAPIAPSMIQPTTSSATPVPSMTPPAPGSMAAILEQSAPAQDDGIAQVDLSGNTQKQGLAAPVAQPPAQSVTPPAQSVPPPAQSVPPPSIGGNQQTGIGATGDPVLDSMFGNMFSSLGKDPRFDTGKGGPGATYSSPGGDRVSIPTSQTASLDQQTIQAISRVIPIIKDISKNLPQFQNFWTRQQEKMGGLGNEFFGGDYQLPSQHAQGKADLKNSAEGLIRAWGLRPTNYQTKVMMGAIEPQKGESANGYAQRLVSTLQTLQSNANLARQSQSQGISLKDSNKIYTWNPKIGSIE